MKNNIEKGFKLFKKAATMNPTDENIYHNILGASKILDKEEEVKKLYERLLAKVD